ncbi:glycosyltransferase family protein [Tessaracoccus antarcticus]|uniref:Glycosyltransferase family 1 protein n=1 Tax=Tessaracoccus antarcticus TaxID=2479848 RepID=A0A3M0G866_9ACTN|nr:glycosyltransferase family 1 protein [Tessaracoccus antarcticus]RMB61231.1 glycosyltransferase family 1 protein [Tessaracoccus antarcticus]
MTGRQVVLYGDVNLNVLDGSATWLVSLAETLTLTDSTLHVVLKAHVTTDRLLTRIADHPRVVIHPPITKPGYSVMSQAEAVTRLEGVVQDVGAGILIVRGREMAAAAGSSEVLSPRLWSYVTDLTFPATTMPPEQLAQLRDIATRSHRFFAQTEETRAYLEAIVPEAAGKCLLMTPTIPDEFFVPLEESMGDRPLQLVYSGKLHPDWKTLQSMELPARLAAVGCPATLTILGDKVYSPEPLWISSMQSALEAPPPRVTWAGGVPREEALRVIAEKDLGLSWRSSDLDSSLEISTKMLEYAASGTPPILNRTPAHEALFGKDYPLFVDETIESVIQVVSRCRPLLPATRVAAQEAVRPYASSVTAQRLEAYFRRSESGPDVDPLATGVVDAERATQGSAPAPLGVDVPDFDRPKHPGSGHAIAMMGFVPYATRPDLALDLLEALIVQDPGFRLHIMGPQPWDCPPVWRQWEERELYLTFFDRIGSTPGLLDHVVFEPPRRDTANWLRSIGWVMFPPDVVAPASVLAQVEASGATALLFPPPDDAALVGDEPLHTTIEAMAEFIMEQGKDNPASEAFGPSTWPSPAP